MLSALHRTASVIHVFPCGEMISLLPSLRVRHRLVHCLSLIPMTIKQQLCAHGAKGHSGYGRELFPPGTQTIERPWPVHVCCANVVSSEDSSCLRFPACQ